MQVSLSKRLRLPGSSRTSQAQDLRQQLWRIHKDEFMGSFAIMRYSFFFLCFIIPSEATFLSKCNLVLLLVLKIQPHTTVSAKWAEFSSEEDDSWSGGKCSTQLWNFICSSSTLINDWQKRILSMKFCRCLGLIVDANLVKILPFHTFGQKKTWMMISVEPYLRWRIIDSIYNLIYSCNWKSKVWWWIIRTILEIN